MQSQRCENCNAWLRESASAGLCRANPPTAIMLGMGQSGGVLRNSMSQAEPVIQSYFPTMQAHGWCRQWQEKVGGRH